jgi:uncharacterized membrane protein YcaP (DUF421 family)
MEIVLRTLVMFSFIVVLTRAMGKKELSELTAFELILLITIGDLAQQGVTQEDQSLTGAMLVVGTIGLLVVGLSYLGYRWKGVRPVIEGLPVVVIRDGRPVEEAMRLERLTMEELEESARHQGIGDLSGVRIAILEPDGRFSFIQKEDGQGGSAPEQEHHAP